MEPQQSRYNEQQSTPELGLKASSDLKDIPIVARLNAPEAKLKPPSTLPVPTSREFLYQKYEADFKNAQTWRSFTFVASVAGIAVIFFGVATTIILALNIGILVGGLVGGLSTSSGLITNIYLHLVYNPAEKANEQLEHTYSQLAEKMQQEEDWQLLGRLDEKEQQEYLKQYLSNHISSLMTPSQKAASKKARRPPPNQKSDTTNISPPSS